MNCNLELVYLELLSEAKYDDDKWQRYDVYKGIEVYYNIDHVLNRLDKRYSTTLGTVRRCVLKFIKEILKDNILSLNTPSNTIPFTCHCVLSDIWFSGEFKRTNNIWRCKISTLLPNINTTFNKHDLRKDINI